VRLLLDVCPTDPSYRRVMIGVKVAFEGHFVVQQKPDT